MKLIKRINITFFLVILAILIIAGLSFFIAINLFTDLGVDYKWHTQRLNISIYTLIIISFLTAASGVIISKALMNRIFNLIEEIRRFTKSMIQGDHDVKIDIKGSDELSDLASNLNNMAESYREKMSDLQKAIANRQKAVRELAILNELMSFITSEFKFDTILKNFVDRTKDLIKSGYCAAITFEPGSFKTKVYVTSDDIQDPSTVHLDHDGFFKLCFDSMIPLRLASDENEEINIQELNLNVRNLLAVPLTSSNKLAGLLILADKLEGSYDENDEDMMMNFAFQAFQTISMHNEITSLAITDGLTGINNHRHFQERLSEEIEICKRYNRTLSLLILDVDNFKNFNDIYGHQVGDMVLKSIASITENQIRKTDFAARYGGEEFTVIMPETPFEGAKILSERLRARIEKTPFILPSGENALITVSIGFASIPDNALEKTELIEMADKALYYAKEHGKNLAYGFEESYKKVREDEPFEAEQPAIENLANIVDSRTPYTKGHSVEVARLSISLAKELGLHEKEIESLRIASILHDIGTMHIPERILNKPGKLTEEETKVIQAHPGLAEMVLKNYPLIETILPIILYHHERFDGNGYPAGISGDKIPLHARILAITEAFHAMISPRPYKKKLTVKEAIDELKSVAGSQFDPHLVDAFVKVINP